MAIDPAFIRSFGVWLNADAIDLCDRSDLLRQAESCAIAVHDEVSDLESLILALTEYLANPTLEESSELMESSIMDWMAGEEEQQALRDVLGAIIHHLREIQVAVRLRNRDTSTRS